MARAQGIDWRPLLAPGGAHAVLVHAGSGPARVARHRGGRLAFVAAPYAQEVQDPRGWRADLSVRLSLLAAREVMRLRVEGVVALCPVLMQAAMLDAACLVPDAPGPEDAAGWADWAQPMLEAAGVVVVPDIPGWQRCGAIWGQVQWALRRNVPVHVYAGAAA